MNRSRAAILAVDLQNEYRHDATWPISGYDAILANTAAVMAAARRANVPVIHVQAWVEEAERAEYARLDECLPDELRSAVAGSFGAEICAEVMPVAGDIVVRKKWASAFRHTGLDDDLRERGIEDLVVTGVWTDSCVRGSVFDAVYLGYRVWLVKDACGSMTEMMHRVALLDMANRLYGGGVMVTAETVKALAGADYRAWTCTRPIEFQYDAENYDRLYEAL
ncbi:MAG TPA: isochorismatase family cysteine hydrolase [Nordella sp.]|nr:isochorismatase family cysteine hydrolase [Nordella sp.]